MYFIVAAPFYISTSTSNIPIFLYPHKDFFFDNRWEIISYYGLDLLSLNVSEVKQQQIITSRKTYEISSMAMRCHKYNTMISY